MRDLFNEIIIIIIFIIIFIYLISINSLFIFLKTARTRISITYDIVIVFIKYDTIISKEIISNPESHGEIFLLE